MRTSRLLSIAAAIAMSMATAAASVAATSAETMLAIFDKSEPAKPLEISRDALLAMPKQSVKTATPWTEGVVDFEGVALADLLSLSVVKPTTIHAIALNDYAVDIPAEDASIPGVIVAYKMNGEFISVRDKGPLWLIYPLSGRPDLDTEGTRAKMIWQLKALELR